MHRLEDAEACVDAACSVNRLVQECITDPELFPGALAAADEAARRLIGIVGGWREEAGRLGIPIAPCTGG
jgi:hypothetical protein